jgi:hypothetical protein
VDHSRGVVCATSDLYNVVMSSGRTRVVLAMAAVTAVIAALVILVRPLLRAGFAAGHDTPAHVTYTYLFDAAVRQGQFPVRWVEGVKVGHSQPLFNFYQPGLYYLIEATHLVVPSLALSLKLTVVLLWWLGAGFMLLLFLDRGRYPALLAAVSFAYAPYLLLDVFVRAAYPELAAITFAVGALWASSRSLDSTARLWHFAALAMSTSLLLVCHLPTSVIVSPIFVALVVSRAAAGTTTRRQIATTCTAAMAGVGMAAFYVMPALAELSFVRIRELTADYFDYHRHFVYPRQWMDYHWGYGGSIPGPRDEMSFQVGVVQWAAILAGLAWLAVRTVRRALDRDALSMIGWLCVTFGALYLMTGAAARIWDAVPPLAYVQFPWRLLMLVAIASAAIAATLLAQVRSQSVQAVIVVTTVIALVALTGRYRQPAQYLPADRMSIDSRGWRYTAQAQSVAFFEQGYFPVGVTRLPSGDGDRWAVLGGDASVAQLYGRDDRIVLQVTATTAAVVAVRVHAFPGWQVFVDGRHVPFDVQPEYAFLVVPIPVGDHRIEARLTNTPIRSCANAISLTSLSGLLIACVAGAWRSCRQTRRVSRLSPRRHGATMSV